jgi:uncharacterized surface protein with fasciclin (FAS1) repeats
MVKFVFVGLSAAVAKDIPLATFDGAEDTTLTWTQKNDPVMGGQSTGTFTVENNEGVFDGTCKIVPSLGAPGFIKAETSKTTLPDVSSCTGLALTLMSSTDYDGFRFSFGTSRSDCGKFFASGHKANFKAPQEEFGTVQIPFTDFTNCWDDGTGDAIKTCTDDAKYCPDEGTLSNMQTMSVWAEGKEGDVHLEIKSVVATGCADSLESAKPNIVELAQSVDDLSTLVTAVVAADLADTLSSPGPFTVFAPTNEGFGKLPAGTVDSLLKPENKAQLADILTYHVLPAQVASKDLTYFQEVPTVEGQNLVITADSKVLVGPSVKDLKRVTSADNSASNGVVHIIDGVMLPPSNMGASATPNIVELAQSVDDLSTLVTAVVAADLADTLSSPGPFTVFAPTNKGFAALPAGTVDTLLKPENKAQLADILTYHVLPAQVLSKDLTYFQEVPTVEGKKLVITADSKVLVGPSVKDLKRVTSADNTASNGVVHIIDGVMLPPSDMVVV